MSFTLIKMEEEAEKCRLWSKKEITEIIKVFPDDADKDKVKDIVAKMAFARKPLVVARLDSWKMDSKIKGDDCLSSRTRHRRKFLLSMRCVEIKEEKAKKAKKATPSGRGRGGGGGGRGGYFSRAYQPGICKGFGQYGHYLKECPFNEPEAMEAPAVDPEHE